MYEDGKITIRRWYHKEWVEGILHYKDFRCRTLELPWRDNQNNVSCVVPGTYEGFKRLSPSNGNVIELRDVPGRTFIQLHSGSYLRNTRGCLLVGDSIRWDPDALAQGRYEPMIINSRVTMGRLLDLAPQEVMVQITDR